MAPGKRREVDGLNVTDHMNKLAGFIFMAIIIGPLLYGLYLEIKREYEEKKQARNTSNSGKKDSSQDVYPDHITGRSVTDLSDRSAKDK